LVVALLSLLAIGVYGFFGPFWALPCSFLTGFSAAAGLALINSAGNLAGFVGPYMIGTLSNRTHNLTAGLAFAGAFMFAAMILILLLPRSPLPDRTRVNHQVTG
jgi:ACS family tartrate transporter-like MFS transporter